MQTVTSCRFARRPTWWRCARLVRARAVDAGFSLVDQTRIVTAASELARNTLDYGGGGHVRIDLISDGRTGLQMTFEDEGPGIADVEQALRDGFTTGRGLGLGLGGTRRLMNDFRSNRNRARERVSSSLAGGEADEAARPAVHAVPLTDSSSIGAARRTARAIGSRGWASSGGQCATLASSSPSWPATRAARGRRPGRLPRRWVSGVRAAWKCCASTAVRAWPMSRELPGRLLDRRHHGHRARRGAAAGYLLRHLLASGTGHLVLARLWSGGRRS